MGSRENRKSCVILAASSEKKTAAVGSGWHDVQHKFWLKTIRLLTSLPTEIKLRGSGQCCRMTAYNDPRPSANETLA